MVLQHYKEQGHAKNTVKLLKLAFPKLVTHIIKDDTDVVHVFKDIDLSATAVFFPNNISKPLEEHKNEFEKGKIKTLIFIDGSWKQASGIANRILEIQHTQFFHFHDAISTQYEIRHTKRDNALSTLEAVGFALEKGFNVSSEPLLNLLIHFQRLWQSPASHRRKNGSQTGIDSR